MILNNPDFQWIYVIPSNPHLPYKGGYDFPRTKETYLEHWGKWVFMDTRENLDEIARKLDPHVEEREIHSIIDLKVGGWVDSLCGAFVKEMSLWKIVVGGPPSEKRANERQGRYRRPCLISTRLQTSILVKYP